MCNGRGLHGYACGQIRASLVEYAAKPRAESHFPDNVGFIVNLPNRRSFSPDAAFWTGGPPTSRFVEGAPVFAVEVRSLNDFGAAAVRALTAKRCGGPYGRGARAEVEPVLPGWLFPVDNLFPPAEN